MNTVMTARVINIDNSRGIRIPKFLLDQLGFGEEVELAVQWNQLIVRPIQRRRCGWDEQFKLMAESGDDRLLDG